jgi:hypothetical protein
MKVVVFQKPMGAKGPGQQEPVTSVGRVGDGRDVKRPSQALDQQEY